MNYFLTIKKNFNLYLFFAFSLSTLLSQSLMDFFAGLILIFSISVFLKQKNIRQLSGKIFWGIELIWIIFIPWIFIGLYSHRELNPEWWKHFIEFLWVPFLYGAIWQLIKSKDYIFKKHQMIFVTFSTALLLASLFAVVVFFLKYNPLNQTSASIVKNSTYIWRTGGFFRNSMPFAHSYAIAACLIFGLAVSEILKKINLHSLLFLVSSMVAFLAIIFSFTRGVWLGLTLSLPLIVFMIRPRLAIYSILISTLVVIFMYTNVEMFKKRIDDTIHLTTSSDHVRPVLWRTNWEIFKDHPWFGVGYGQNKDLLKEYYIKTGVPENYFLGHAHNQYLQWFAGTGIVGFMCYMIFIGSLLWISLKVYFYELIHNKLTWRKGLIVGAIGGQVCFHIGSLTEANFSIAKNRYMFLFLASIIVFLYKTIEEENQILKSKP